MKKFVLTIVTVAMLSLLPTSTQAYWRVGIVDNSDNEDGFKIWRKDGPSGTYAVVGQVAANVITYNDTTSVVGVNYAYKIEAFNQYGSATGPETNSTALAPAAPGAPQSVWIP